MDSPSESVPLVGDKVTVENDKQQDNTQVSTDTPVSTVNIQTYIDISIQQQLTSMGERLAQQLKETCTTLVHDLHHRSEDPTGNRPPTGSADPVIPPAAPLLPGKKRLRPPEGSALAEDRHGKRRQAVGQLPKFKQPSQDAISLFASDSEFDGDGEGDTPITPISLLGGEDDYHSDLDDHMRAALSDSIVLGESAPNIKHTLASATKLLWQTALDKQKVQEKLDNLIIPDNCPFLNVQRTNDEIFSQLRPETAAQDVHIQQNLKILAKTAVPLLTLLDDLASLKPGHILQQSDIASLTTAASNALTLLSHQNNRMVQERKNKIVRTLSSDLKGLRKVNDLDSDLLFGADIVTRIQTLKRGQQSVLPKASYPRGRPYQTFSRRGRSDKPYTRKNSKPFPNTKTPWKGPKGAQSQNQQNWHYNNKK